MFGRRPAGLPAGPYAHGPDCKTPDAEPDWWRDEGDTWRRVCSCGSQSWNEPPPRQELWRPDPVKHFPHGDGCPMLSSPASFQQFVKVEDVGTVPGLHYKVTCPCRPDLTRHVQAAAVRDLPVRVVEFI